MMAASTASRRRAAANQDLPRQPSLISASSLSPLMSDHAGGGSISMDDLLKNIYADADAPTSSATTATAHNNPNPASSNRGADPPPPLFPSVGNDAGRTVDEVWKDIVAGPGRHHLVDGGRDQQVTLEDFLYRARTPVEAAAAAGPEPGAAAAPLVVVNGSLIQPQGQLGVAGGGVGGGRGKRRAQVQEEPPVDKATQQKQRRMIKNRESAARSRERKQAYTAELESLVTQLEEEHAQLLREEAEVNKEKCAKMVKTIIPVTDGKRPPRTLRRVQSM